MDLQQISPDALAKIQSVYRHEVERRRETAPADFFPWHEIQEWLLNAPDLTENAVRIILAAGGNRGGKSKAGMGIYSQVLRRESGLNKQLRTIDPVTSEIRPKGDTDPLTIWIVPPTLEKARQDWLSPQDQMGLKFWAGDLFVKHRETPDNVVYTRPPGLDPDELYDADGKLRKEVCDKTIIKSQDQSLETFESSEVDMVIFDEELSGDKAEQKWNSCLLRIATTNGFIIMTYTPLHGLSWSYKRYWSWLVEQGHAKEMADRCWIHDPDQGATVICAQMGSRDNPRAREYADEIEADPEMTQAEKDSRLYGKYGFVEGTLIPDLAGIDVLNPVGRHQQYVVDTLPGMKMPSGGRVPGRIVDWFLVADPNKSYGAVLSAVDTDGNLFLVSEHLEESWPDRLHVQAFRKMENRYATGRVNRYADPGSAGAHSMVNLADLGMYFNTMPKGSGSVSRSVKRLRGLAYVDPKHRHPITNDEGAPRLYFYRPGMLSTEDDKMGRKVLTCRTADQISQARQTDNPSAPPDTPHKDTRSKLDLFDCVRYTAELLSLAAVEGDERGVNTGPGENRLPSDATLRSRHNRAMHEDDFIEAADFYVPDYEFSGGTW